MLFRVFAANYAWGDFAKKESRVESQQRELSFRDDVELFGWCESCIRTTVGPAQSSSHSVYCADPGESAYFRADPGESAYFRADPGESAYFRADPGESRCSRPAESVAGAAAADGNAH
jgi:hypothetical protein